MNKIYTSLILSLTLLLTYGQNYDLGIIHMTGYNFKVVAIPDFDSSGNTDISDVGFALMLPAGSFDITNVAGLLGGRTWSTTEYDAAFLSGLSLGDGTRDAWAFNLPPGQTLLAHTAAQQIDLVSFTVTNSPNSGVISLLANSDPIAVGAGGVLDSFYNSNIDNTTTQDYFSAIAPGLGSFDFATLSDSDPVLNSHLLIYPNPASDYIFIETSADLTRVVIYNVAGKKVTEMDFEDKIDVGKLASGLYFIEVQDLQNKKAIRKIVID
ncbi:MAG: T9SS type A sorting domain-containing protein [Flavobacteriaceae bacterium]|nr:T9SS type A sorting domain-containing protein [Flavobacteriaceae bacterium]